jgi:D-psicose/D-tagatose/L-ribulose 3-epimerase
LASLGAHTAVWTAYWDEEGAERAASGAAEAGLDFLEIPLGDPAAFDVASTRDLLEAYGLGCTCSVGLPPDAHAPDAPEKAAAFLEAAVEVAAALDSQVLTGEVYTCLGAFTGRPPEKAEIVAVARVLKRAARHAAESGISLGVQPVNRFETYLVNTAAGADEMIDRVGEPNVFAHLDTFHMNVEEKGFRDPVLRLGERLRYVHLSESDRGTPGTGNVRWDELFGALAEIRFDGRLVLESFVHPDPDMTRLAALWRDVSHDPEEPLREGLPFLRKKAEEYGLMLR